MKFLHILVRHFGIFSARIPTYLVVKYLSKFGHQNIILNNDYTSDDEEKTLKFIRSIGKRRHENFLAIMRALLTLDYDVVIVYDTLDAMLSSPAPLIKILLPLLKGNERRKKFIYYNLELFSLDYDSAVKRIAGRSLEQIFISGCDAFIALSPVRLKLAERIFRIPCKKFVVPNSFDFEAKEIKNKPHKPFKLLYAGGIEDYIFDGLFDELKNIDFEFTIHGTSKYGVSKMIERLKENRNIIIDMEVIRRYHDFTDFVSRYDAGFVWYPIKTLNERFASLSSSKYFRYLSLGKPVITRNLPEIAETTIQNNFGLVINDFSELKDAVKTLSERYGEFVEGILQNYHKFEFSRNFSKVYEFIAG